VAFEAVEIGGFRRKLSMENVRTVMKFIKAVKRSKALLQSFKPDVVVGTGGYVCGPVVYAAARLGIPTLIHEQNVIPGLTNKFLSRYADSIAVSFKDSVAYFGKHPNVIYTGNPCASNVMLADAGRGYASLGIKPGSRIVLIVGGSRGARAINEAMADLIPRLNKLPGIHIVLVTGESNYEQTVNKLGAFVHKSEGHLHILPYIHNMPEVLAATSLIVNRSGASFIAEITALGIPSILIPSPNVTNNHQEPNARTLADAGAAEMILERELTGETLLRLMSSIMNDPNRQASMREASRKLGFPQSAEVIAGELLKLTGRS
jgi:UDP-N-acetylglucosamine--N-acetylmuramyl-(pentapeptide) pyrophosphoryl-undecaprenol N-acetylglucosamine transferase